MFIDFQDVKVIMDGAVQNCKAPDNNSYGGDVSANEITVKYLYKTISIPSTTVIVSYTVNKSGKIKVDVHYNGKTGLPEFRKRLIIWYLWFGSIFLHNGR